MRTQRLAVFGFLLAVTFGLSACTGSGTSTDASSGKDGSWADMLDSLSGGWFDVKDGSANDATDTSAADENPGQTGELPPSSATTDSGCCKGTWQAGCETKACADCVCTLDPYCCEQAWDSYCVNAAAAQCQDTCGCQPSCGMANPADYDTVVDVCTTEIQNICMAGDGLACDDGNRCTAGDVCESNACLSGPEISCNDNNPCTDDGCAKAKGCVHVPNTNACKVEAGVGTCKDGTCVVVNCLDGRFDLNGQAEDGCEAVTGPTVDPTSAQKAGKITDYNHKITPSASVGANFTFQAVANTGQQGDVFGLGVGLNLENVKFEQRGGESEPRLTGVVRFGSGSEVLTVSAVGDETGTNPNRFALKLAPGSSWKPFDDHAMVLTDVGGVLSKHGSTWAVTLRGSAPSIQVGPGFVLTGVQFDAFLQPNGKWALDFEGLGDVGPFRAVHFRGTLSKHSPVTGCFTGVTTITLDGFFLENVNVNVCLDTNGVLTVEVLGTVMVEGSPVTFNGPVTPTAPWAMDLEIAELELSPDISVVDVVLGFDQGDATVDFSGTFILGSGTEVLELDVAGTYLIDGDMTLQLSQAANTSWKPFDDHALTITGASGELQRTNGEWSVSPIEAPPLAFAVSADLTLTNTEISASVASNGTWSLSVSASSAIGPFSQVSVTGTIGVETPGGPVAGCVSGTVEVDAALSLNVTATACVLVNGTTTFDFEGTLSLTNLGQINVSGEYANGSLCMEGDVQITQPAATLGAGFCISGGVVSDITFSGPVQFGSLEPINLSGIYNKIAESLCLDGTYALTGPISASLTVDGCVTGGSLDSTTFSGSAQFGQTATISMSGSWDAQTEEVCLSGAFGLSGPPTGTLTASGCIDAHTLESAAFEGTVQFGQAATATMSGTYDAGNDELCLSGNVQLTGNVSGSLTANGCIISGELQSVTFQGNAQFGPAATVALTGAYDAQNDTICLSGNHTLVGTIGGSLSVSGCLSEGDLDSATFSGSVALGSTATVALTGSYDSQSSSLCLGGQLTISAGASGTLDVEACLMGGALQSVNAEGTAQLGTTTAIVLQGSYDAQADELCLDGNYNLTGVATGTLDVGGCFSAGELQNVTFSGGAQFGNTATVNVSGSFDAQNDTLCLTGALALTGNVSGTLNVDGCLQNGALSDATFGGNVQVGGAAEATVIGSYDAQNDSLCVDGTSTLSGNVPATLNVSGCLVDGELENVAFSGTVALAGVGNINLSGTYDAQNDSLCLTGTLALTGAVPATLNVSGCVV
ncbi:MAG: hypothetical protein HUU55_23285, partial [Myxococcales bacterium]|nr:hypothetical protein [Myxococcales bacterium]